MYESHDDVIRLEVFKHLFASVAEEMGVVLRKSAFSPNIKERRDYSCAIFDGSGQMISQAAHIPVHLGAMSLSVQQAISDFEIEPSTHIHPSSSHLAPGDMIILNDPYRGGTHLPDITLVSPVFIDDNANSRPFGFVANRAHHADVGGMMAGSMPVAREIYQEGLIIPPAKLLSQGVLNQAVFDMILANVRTPVERQGDIWAQIAANQRGVNRLITMVKRYGADVVGHTMQSLIAYTARMVRQLIAALKDGTYSFTDYMDDDGLGHPNIPISVKITVSGDHAIVDFTGSALQQEGSINAVYAITLSAVYYVFRCLVGLDVPNNSGCLASVTVIAPEGTVVNAKKPAPVAGGNVETSQRIVDVLLGALAQAAPDLVPAASQGTMNNLTIGGYDCAHASAFAYYETIGGGMGGRPERDGLSAIHTHMTNTLNTPVEALEYAYPLRVLRYEVRIGTAGIGQHAGGQGIRRDIQVLTKSQVSILSERRVNTPYGLAGGTAGAVGQNYITHNGTQRRITGKGTFYLDAGDIVSIRTPGGGGFGVKDDET